MTKWYADQTVTAIPVVITITDNGMPAFSGRRLGRFSIWSKMIAAKTNKVVNMPKIKTPIGVSKVRVFLVLVAAL
jgi:hypothetical protein